MPRDAELLAAIHANRADDAPRTIYADALSERGDPRGEFIQLQLRSAGGDQTMYARERELSAHCKAWQAEAGIADAITVHWNRGFPHTLILHDLAALLASRAAIATTIVGLDLLGLASERAELAELAAWPELARIERLELAGDTHSRPHPAPASRALAGLAASPHLTGVRWLRLMDDVIDDEGARLLGAAPWLSQIEDLAIGRMAALTATGFAALIANGRGVRTLYAGETAVGEAGARALAPHALRELALFRAHVAGGARVLFTAPALATLERLSIEDDWCPGELAALVAAPQLRELRLERCSIEASAAATFARDARLPSLVKLELADNQLDATTATAFARAPGLAQLAHLDLRRNTELGTAGLAALAARTGLPALAHLGLSGSVKSGATHVYEWESSTYGEGGSQLVEEMLTPEQLQASLANVRVF